MKDVVVLLGVLGIVAATVGFVVLCIEAVTILHTLFGPVGVGGALFVIGLMLLGGSYGLFLKMEQKS